MTSTEVTKRTLITAAMFIVLALIYIFQRFDFFSFVGNFFGLAGQMFPNTRFAFNRVIRLIVNDTACIVLISVWFRHKNYTRLAGYLFLVEVFLILPLYLWIKLSLEGDSEISSPILSQVHRLIVNPMLMILLMVAFVYQRWQESAPKQ